MKNKLVFIMLTVFFILQTFPARAENENITIMINGYQYTVSEVSEIKNGVIMIPFFNVLNFLGYTTGMTSDKNTVTVKNSKINVSGSLSYGSNTAVANGKTVLLDHEIYMSDKNYTLFPVSYLHDLAGYDWEYNSTSRVLDIYTNSKIIIQKLHKFDEICDYSVLKSIMNLYDNNTGGFYYSMSAKLNEPYGTNIESTSQALSFFGAGGINLNDIIPQKTQEKIISYIQGCQNEENGYFYNDWQGTQVYQAKRERDLTYAVSILNKFGAKPLYPLPSERIKEKSDIQLKNISFAAVNTQKSELEGINDYLANEESFISWLDSLNWNDPYSTGHTLASSKSTITAAGYGRIMAEYIANKQNVQTGLWGEGVNYAAVNGAMKLSAIFTSDIMEYPNIEKMVHSVLELFKNGDVPPTICSVWNPLILVQNAVESCKFNINENIRNEIEASIGSIIDITRVNTMRFKQADGGFSYYPEHGQKSTHGSPIGLGLAEGDVDATYIASLQMRKVLYNLAGYSYMPPQYKQYTEEIKNLFAVQSEPKNTALKLNSVEFSDVSGKTVHSFSGAEYTAKLTVYSPILQNGKVITAKYKNKKLESVESKIFNFVPGINIVQTNISKNTADEIKVFLWNETMRPLGHCGILNAIDNESSLNSVVFIIEGKEYKAQINPVRHTAVADIILTDSIRKGLKNVTVKTESTGTLTNRNSMEILDFTNKEYIYTIEASNGSKADYAVKIELSDAQRTYDFNGAELLPATHETKARRCAPAYLPSTKGVGMWYNEGYAFDSSGTSIENETYGNINIIKGDDGNDCMQLEKTKQGGVLGIRSVAGDKEAYLSNSKITMGFKFNLVDYVSNNDGIVYIDCAGTDHFIISCRNAPENKYYIGYRAGWQQSHETVTNIELDKNSWHEVTYIFRKYPETEAGYTVEIYLDNIFICEVNGTYKENDQILKPDGCINMNKGSAFTQMRLRSWRNSLYKMQIDDFICTAIRDKL